VARIGKGRVYKGVGGETGEEETNYGDIGVDGWIIIGRICRRWCVGIWTGLGRPRIETGGGRV